jgi:hypothetical protein
MAIQANLIGRLPELCVIAGAVDVMARETGYPVAIHDALRKIIALHSILVRGAIGEEQEVGLPQCAVFELPEILKARTDLVTDRPIVIFPLNWNGSRTPL